MKLSKPHIVSLGTLLIFLASSAVAQNPLINYQFTADPSARVFSDKVLIDWIRFD